MSDGTVQGLDRLDERKRPAVLPLLASGESVEEVFGHAVFTSRQLVVCTTSLSGGFRDPFAVSAVGFRYADIVAVVPVTITALRGKNRRFLVEVGTAAMPAHGRPTDAERMSLKFSNGWADPLTVDESYVARPNVVLAGDGNDGERLAQRIVQELVKRREQSRTASADDRLPSHSTTESPQPDSMRQAFESGSHPPDWRAKLDSSRVKARGLAEKLADAASSAIQDGLDKTCPDCAESVKANARVCRYCGFRFAPPPERA